MGQRGKRIVGRRVREPSTWAGLAALAALFGVPGELAGSLPAILGALAAVASILLPERGGAD